MEKLVIISYGDQCLCDPIGLDRPRSECVKCTTLYGTPSKGYICRPGEKQLTRSEFVQLYIEEIALMMPRDREPEYATFEAIINKLYDTWCPTVDVVFVPNNSTCGSVEIKIGRADISMPDTLAYCCYNISAVAPLGVIPAHDGFKNYLTSGKAAFYRVNHVSSDCPIAWFSGSSELHLHSFKRVVDFYRLTGFTKMERFRLDFLYGFFMRFTNHAPGYYYLDDYGKQRRNRTSLTDPRDLDIREIFFRRYPLIQRPTMLASARVVLYRFYPDDSPPKMMTDALRKSERLNPTGYHPVTIEKPIRNDTSGDDFKIITNDELDLMKRETRVTFDQLERLRKNREWKKRQRENG
jgi:hypothetical protein